MLASFPGSFQEGPGYEANEMLSVEHNVILQCKATRGKRNAHNKHFLSPCSGISRAEKGSYNLFDY